jgi:hypothetical protein
MEVITMTVTYLPGQKVLRAFDPSETLTKATEFENEGATLTGQKREEVFPDPVSCEQGSGFMPENKGLIADSSGGGIAFHSLLPGFSEGPVLAEFFLDLRLRV